MDGFINTKIEAQTIYEIYRACRLCGAGAGYKMPIIQNVVDLDGSEVELKQKIRDCVQIEVHQDDKMPPLICELCVDKVNDFYEFLEMCRQTNKRTRLRLGLPPQTMPRGAPDAGDCILGITEPVFISEDDNEPLIATRTKSLRGNIRSGKSKNQDTKIKIQLPPRKDIKRNFEAKSLRSRQPSPPRLRGTKRLNEDDVSLGSLQKSKRSTMPMPKSILKKTENENLTSRLRGSKEKEREPVKKESSNKKVQILLKTIQAKNEKNYCKLCKIQFNNYRSYSNHARIHANVKPPERRVNRKEKSVACEDCEKLFPNKNVLETHSCSSVTCSTCGRKFSSRKALTSHRNRCTNKKKASVINPSLMKKVKPMQIRVARCDSLLENHINEHYDVSRVPFDYGLDNNCIYPYITRTLRIKSEPGYMVSINDDIKDAFDTDKYIHWDSEDTATDSEVEDTKKVDSLTTIALKSIFSPKILGKVPKKRRKVKAEKAFDSILNASDIDCNDRLGIDSIIDRLNDTIDATKDKSGDNDSLFGDDRSQSVTNDDFDTLFGAGRCNDKTVGNDNVDSLFAKNNDNDVNKSVDDSVGVGIKVISEIPSDTKSYETTVCSDNDKGLNANDSNERIDESTNNDIVNDACKVDGIVESKGSNENESNDDSVGDMLNKIKIDVQYDNDSEKSNLELNKLNETDSKEVSDADFNDKNVSSNEANDLNKKNDEVTNNDASNEESVNETDNKHDSLQSVTSREDNKENDSDVKDGADNENDKETSNSTDKMEMTEADKRNNTNENAHVNGDDLDKFNMEDLEDVTDSEMDDKKLMAELDAQIGEDKRAV